LPRAFGLDDATWLNERIETRRTNAVPSAAKIGTAFPSVGYRYQRQSPLFE